MVLDQEVFESFLAVGRLNIEATCVEELYREEAVGLGVEERLGVGVRVREDVEEGFGVEVGAGSSEGPGQRVNNVQVEGERVGS